jgi:predicted AlkP superfamily pyrophosphatase or phosphodiesterase
VSTQNDLFTRQSIIDDNTNINMNKLLLVSIDGFRNDYINNYNLENMMSIIKDGVSASYLKPQFLTQLLPTHWSIVTGMYSESHGLVSNDFYDPLYNETFKYNNHHKFNDLKWWNLTEPIWFTAVKEGLRCGNLFWPGGSVKYMKTNLYKTIDHNESASLDEKFNQAIKWFVKENYNLVTLYHNELDTISHRYGISSLEFNATIKDIDSKLGIFVKNLKNQNLYDNQNFHLIIVSGHGMVEVQKHVFLDDYINFSLYKAKLTALTSTNAFIQVSGDIDDLISILNEVPYITAYTKETIPDKWYYKNNIRIGDILILANEGINLHLRSKLSKQIVSLNLNEESLQEFLKVLNDKANHGYDNSLNSMRTIFIGRSSLLRKNYKSSRHVEQVDVYPLMCHLLDLECLPNINGSFNRIKHFLMSSKSLEYKSSDASRLVLFNKIINIFLLFILPFVAFFKIFSI